MKTLLAGTILMGLTIATPTMAGTLGYNGYGMAGPESYITISNSNGVIGAATIGQIVLHNTIYDGTVLHNISYGDVPAWCIDLYDDLQGSGAYTVSTGNYPLSPDTLGKIGALMAYSDRNFRTDPLVRPGTQVAIWMLEYPDLVFWNETLPGTVAEANALLAKDLPPVYGMQKLSEDGNQTLLKAPEPMTLTILGTGLLGLGLLRRRSA
jgi:hypothetical protein